MRKGYSTGTCAAAAAKAATRLLLTGKASKFEIIHLPDGEEIEMKLEREELDGDTAICCVLKDGGDDPDVTHGTPICAEVRLAEKSSPLLIKGGKGIGRVTKAGLKIPVGEPAINPVPRAMIMESVTEVLPPDKSVEVTIFAPMGEEIAQKTLNAKLGIYGGISILGTSGRVRPMSNEAFKTSLLTQLDVAKAAGHDVVCLVPGGSGEMVMQKQYGVPEDAVCQMSNWVGFMLEEAAIRDFSSVLLAGHIGKLCKIAGGIFDTHSKVADARLEIIAAYTAYLGAGQNLIKQILEQISAEAAIEILLANNMQPVIELLAEKASSKASAYLKNKLRVGTMLFNFSGELLAQDGAALEIRRSKGW